MTGSVIDLSAVRATRAADLQAAIAASNQAVEAVTNAAEHFATTAFAISGPMRFVDEQFAVDVNRARWRRTLSVVRKATCKGTPEVRASLVQAASIAFGDKLDALIREDDARRGLTHRDIPVGGMWVTAGRQSWKPTPWPCVTALGRLGTLAWMTHIEHTPYRMKPATRVRFDAVRKEMQGGVTWPGTEAERMLDRIIRTCWKRGWRPQAEIDGEGA